MGASYHQFCPVAKTMEVLDQRWTVLIIRELLQGSQHFNEVRSGVPRMSPTLLSTRLQQLVRAGIVERHSDAGDVRYLLTPAGEELREAVEALGRWGIRWMGKVGDEDLDPKLLLWDMHRNIDRAAIPPGRTVVCFRFPELPPKSRTWWLVVTPEEADVCDVDPGYEVTVTVTSALRRMVEVWRGELTWSDALRSGAIELDGSATLRRSLRSWFTLGSFASVPRPAQMAEAAP